MEHQRSVAAHFSSAAATYDQHAVVQTEAAGILADLAARLTPTYPTLVVSPQGAGTPVYRVVIGPLKRAESGTRRGV